MSAMLRCAAQDVKKNIVSAAAKRMNCAPEDVIMHSDRVYKRGAVAGDNDSEARRYCKTKKRPRPRGRADPARIGVADAQRRRSKRAHEFREAVVSAIDFHGALTGTGSYAPPTEARGGKHKAAESTLPAYSYSAQVADVSVDEETAK